MAVNLRGRSRFQTRPNIPTASMGDIAFLIIIFFMSSSMFAREKGLKIVLPEKGEATKIKAENILLVSVNPAGQVLIGNQVVTIPEVRLMVTRLLGENKDLVISLRVSRRAPYHTMIDVFDQLKLAKAERISLMPVLEEEAVNP